VRFGESSDDSCDFDNTATARLHFDGLGDTLDPALECFDVFGVLGIDVGDGSAKSFKSCDFTTADLAL